MVSIMFRRFYFQVVNKNVEQALTLSPFAKLTKGIQNLGASLGPKNQPQSAEQEQQQQEQQQQQTDLDQGQLPASEIDEYKSRVASSQSRTKFVLL